MARTIGRSEISVVVPGVGEIVVGIEIMTVTEIGIAVKTGIGTGTGIGMLVVIDIGAVTRTESDVGTMTKAAINNLHPILEMESKRNPSLVRL
jgi:hypothetical protein